MEPGSIVNKNSSNGADPGGPARMRNGLVVCGSGDQAPLLTKPLGPRPVDEGVPAILAR